MQKLNKLYNTEWKIKLLLFVSSFVTYFLYFNSIFLHLNSLMSSVTGDALKNYYTYAFHIKNDSSLFEFGGMNFPYGEHVVFTDCQPLLTFILRAMPFTHSYLIGILHALLFFSFIISPVILYQIFKEFKIDSFSSFFLSFSINLLSPQFAKINGGHHGLAYGFIIPLSFLLIIKFIQNPKSLTIFSLIIYNFLLFLIHPYLGFGCSLITFLCISFSSFNFKNFSYAAIGGITPIFLFKALMLVTDKHQDRTVEPYGSEALVENIDTLLAPDFGPFKKILESIFSHKIIHFEGHTYLGLFTIIATMIFLLGLPFYYKKLKSNKILIALLLSALILLFVSFGWHVLLLKQLHLNLSAVLQFRASCRFAWFFYFALPIFLAVTIYQLVTKNNRTIQYFQLGTLLFFGLNLLEANFYFKKDSDVFWKQRNLLNTELLSEKEKTIITLLKKTNSQAIIPLPLYYVGSEMYNRIGGDNSMIASMFYSFHCNLPIMSTWLSRTSISETENAIEILNTYKKNRVATSLLSTKNILIIKTKDDLLPDEERLNSKVKYILEDKELQFGELNSKEILNPIYADKILELKDESVFTNTLVFIKSDNKKPFIESNIKDNNLIFKLDSNKLLEGTYMVSLHYHYQKKIYKSIACDLLITKLNKQGFNWEYLRAMSVLSGFYKGFGVFEYKIKIEKNCEYTFSIYGGMDQTYSISNFMLRPEKTDIVLSKNKIRSSTNNFPD